MALHQMDELVRGKKPAHGRKIKGNDAGAGAVRAHLRVIREYHARLREGRCRGECMLDHRDAQAIVSRGEQDEIAAHEVETGFARGVDATVFRMAANLKPGILRRECVQEDGAPVGRPVVHDDDLERRHGLPRDRVERLR